MRSWGVGILFLFPLASFAQSSAPAVEDVFSILEEEQTVSTGSAVQTKATESPSSVWVIDRKQIESTAAFSLSDVLRRIPGLVPIDVATGDTEIASRGMGAETSDRILFLIDGRSVMSDWFGNSDVNEFPVAIADIERIEVVLGPASTIYGTNAFLAVVNIITKQPDKEGWHVALNGQGGLGLSAMATSPVVPLDNDVHPLGGGHVEYSQAQGAVRWRVAASADVAAPPDQAPKLVLSPYAQLEPYEKVAGLVDVMADVNHWQLRAQAMGSFKSGEFAQTFISNPSDNSWNDYSLNLTAQKPHLFADGDSLMLQIWAREARWQWIDVGFAPPLDDSVNSISSELSAKYASPTFYRNRLVGGVQARVFDVEAIGQAVPGKTLAISIAPGGSLEGIFGGFVEDEFRPIAPLILTAGVRLETRQLKAPVASGRFNVAPRGAIVFLPAAGHSLRAEVATAYRDPSIFEQLRIARGDIADNLALTPEQNIVGTLSYQGSFGWLKPRAEVFYGHRPNLIDITSGTVAGFAVQYRNVNTTDSWGGSVALSATVTRWLDLWAFYNFSEAQAEATAIANSSPNASVFPQHSAGLGGTLSIDRLTVGLQAYVTSPTVQVLAGAVAPQQLQGRVVINPLVRYAIDAAHRYQVFAAGTNVADIRFGPGAPLDAYHLTYQRIGPRFWLGVEIALGPRPAD